MRKLLLGILLIVFAGCNKKPTADFTTDKIVYIAGETIHLTNTTTDAGSYLWTMPDGQTATTKDVDYVTNENEKEGTLVFQLKAFSKKGNKTSEAHQNISLRSATGDVVFWRQPGLGFANTTVTLNGLTALITASSQVAPECGAAGNAVFNEVEVANYSYTATDGIYSWNGSISVKKGVCLKVELN